MPETSGKQEERASVLQQHWFCFSWDSRWKCLRHFVLDSQLLTHVPINSEVNINFFILSQPVTSVLIECSGEEGRGGQVTNSPCADTWQHFSQAHVVMRVRV